MQKEVAGVSDSIDIVVGLARRQFVDLGGEGGNARGCAYRPHSAGEVLLRLDAKKAGHCCPASEVKKLN